MAHELEPIKSVEPSAPDADVPAWYTPPVLTDMPEWLELRPPYRPDSKVEQRWSVAVMPLRAVALSFLWITYRWHRAALGGATVLLIYIVFLTR